MDLPPALGVITALIMLAFVRIVRRLWPGSSRDPGPAARAVRHRELSVPLMG
ncbi:hypothetical protein BH23PLA1_BH23PLA1_32110 [soil metagenome]